MSESKEERIQRLLKEGLDLYGEDDIAGAILTWEEVLELAPGHPEATDYIGTADRRSRPRPKKKGARGRATATEALAAEARALMREGEHAPALDLLRGGAKQGQPSLAYQALLDLCRSRLHQVDRERVGDLGRIPAMCGDMAGLKSLNLSADAGFLISLLDGQTSVADMITLSGMDAFEALNSVSRMIEAGIVELRE